MTQKCQHCGGEHEADARRCARTGEFLTEPGPCGSRIDRYQVETLLGLGGYGAVYVATHSRTGAKVALKVLKRERAHDAASVERFMREARAAALLGSEHIVRVLDAEVSQDGLPFIAMELLDGLDLQELDKAKGPLHPERLVNIMVQALGALQLAHEKGIVHRDMKPANVFVTKRKDALGIERDFVKLLDFGISKMTATGEKALTLAGTAMGTPAYMAYEQFFDARTVDARSDVYSVAAILYEGLSRQRPYVATSYGELVMKVEREEPVRLKVAAPALPDELCAAVDKGLAKKRDERWQTAREFAEALAKVSLRGVMLKTEIFMPAAAQSEGEAMLAETRASVRTTDPRQGGMAGGMASPREEQIETRASLRPSLRGGELRTVLMDAAAPVQDPAPQSPANDTLLRMEAAVIVSESLVTPALGREQAAGNRTMLMPAPSEPLPTGQPSRVPAGNSTVLMPPPSDSEAVNPTLLRLSPPDLASVKGTDPAGRPAVVQDEPDISQKPTAPHAALQEASERPTNPSGGPAMGDSTQESIRAAVNPRPPWIVVAAVVMPVLLLIAIVLLLILGKRG